MTSSKIYRIAGLILFGAFALYAMITGDLWLRAREAYLEGEKYMRWHERPEEKEKALKAQFDKDKAELDRLLAKGRMTAEEYRERMELLEFDLRQASEESSAKYAYLWFQTAVELFTPPESKWIKLSREKMPVAKALWMAELKAQKIPFEEYMLE